MPLQSCLCNPEKCVLVFRPGHGYQNYLFCTRYPRVYLLIFLLPSSDSSFHCHVAPSAGCTHDEHRGHVKPRLAVSRDSIVRRGFQQRAQQPLSCKCKQEVGNMMITCLSAGLWLLKCIYKGLFG